VKTGPQPRSETVTAGCPESTNDLCSEAAPERRSEAAVVRCSPATAARAELGVKEGERGDRGAIVKDGDCRTVGVGDGPVLEGETQEVLRGGGNAALASGGGKG
jgi:hypothetical protein